MEFKEIEGDRAGSKLLETSDHHIYRRNKSNSPYLSCYFSSVTKVMLKTSPQAQKCHATAFVTDDRIEVRNPHNHEPDERQSQRLNARMAVLKAATTSSESLKPTFDAACRELPGAAMLGFGECVRTMRRRRRENYPPPPTDPVAADEFMRSDQYKDQQYAQFYKGMVSSDDGEKGLVFAHPGNLAKLNEDTKTLQTDGTFRTSSTNLQGLDDRKDQEDI